MTYISIKNDDQGYEEMDNGSIIALTDLEDNGLLLDMRTYSKVGDYTFISLN